MYAIIESGNKQYKVEKGSLIDVELLGVEKDTALNLERILLVADGDNIAVGKPFVKGAEVKATVVDLIKDKKVISFKYKSKSNFHKTIGHRQNYTTLKIEDISLK